ncbi:MAG: hypothetical protein JWL60_207 [Gemmatimonadetes bacterium]|jgi:hypothetical protein|nr:hypothetical protein [Gemmatimonadota bacterium]
MTQSASQSPAAAPAAPAAPQAPATARAAAIAGDGSRIVTAADVAALKKRKSELSNLLHNATARRAEVQASVREAAPGPDRAGLEQRLGVLDDRIARLETEIDENSSQLASLDVARFTSSASRPAAADGGHQPGFASEYGAPILICFILFVLAPIAFSVARSIWKRGSRPIAAANPESERRLERIEQAVDAIAIEVERVSEGQRFVTRLMSEGRGTALGAGEAAMEPIRVGEESFVNRR